VLPGEVPFLPNVYLGNIVTGPDGNLWATETDADKIARVTPSGGIFEIDVPTASAGPYTIASGPDGNVWFTEGNFNTIGRITPAGQVTEFPLPPPLATAPQNLQGITAGPDGNIWFVHGGANVIGVMSTSGTLITTYQIPSANPIIGNGGEATYITQGPDGNLWFVENAANKIGKITTSGVITEFPITTPSSDPRNLVVGADRNFWFPEAAAGQVARFTISTSHIDEFPVVGDPTTVRIARVTATADGSIWFTEPAWKKPWTQSEIGKMTTDGVETDLWSFPNGFPWELVTGPDGNPWFSDWNNASINRL
jgi:virginiamycin B lyase